MAIPATVRYLALGDSYTIGTGLVPELSFPAQLAARWRARSLPVELTNLGVNGYTTDELIRDQLPAVPRVAPTVVTLLIGANDVVAERDPQAYRDRIRAILKRLASDGMDPRRLVVISSPDWSRAPQGARFGDPARIASLVDAYVTILRREAERAGSRFFDIVPLSRAQADRGLFAADALHFSADAYREWAEALDSTMAGWGLPVEGDPTPG